ncbi:MAG: hypothetical protein ACAI25_16155 [Planctomycetota bacterium]
MVDHWLDRETKGVPADRLLLLFERAIAALWRRTHVTLGEVTLGAVIERVLYHATEKYPFLAPLEVGHEGVRFERLRQTLDPSVAPVTEAFRFVLVEFLTVIGNLTDDILTPALHSELSSVQGDHEARP